MSNTMNRIASDLQKIISESDKKKTSGFDTQAVVTRLDGDIAWVQFPGGEDETPVRRTTNAGVGDNVQVRVNGGRAWLLGNTTNPPTDDTVANVAMDNAKDANQNAAAAGAAAVQAMESAATANKKAYEASVAAAQAQTDAGIAHTAAEEAKVDAAAANTAATQAKADAAAASTAAGEAKADAQAANTAATEAKADASRANTAANDSLSQLSIVEDVVGTLNWITTHATYKASADTEVHAGKWYFTKSGDTYNVVTNPTGNPSDKGYYEVDTIDEAVSNYVASHLALASEGLYLTKDGNGYKILLANDGLKVYDPEGHLVSTFGESIILDSSRPQTIGNNNVYIKYYDKNNDGTPDSLAIKADEFLLSSGKTIQEELEGVENWFYSVAPTTSNEPAKNWTTDKLKEQHLRDIYFDTTSGKSYRWAKEGTTYKWVEIEDVELAALAKDLHDNYPPRSEFTIAPNQIQSEVSKKVGNSEVISKINQSAETVKIQASKVEIDGSAIFNAIKAKTDAAYDAKGAASTVQTNLDNLQIGGRNLLIGTAKSVSKVTTSTSGYVTQALYDTPGQATLSELGFSANDEVTLSFDWKVTSATTYGNARIDWYGEKGSTSMTYIAPLINPFATFSASNISGHVVTTVKLTSATILSKRILLRIDNSNLTLTISNLKLEKGNKATDWTPAPEDIEGVAVQEEQYIYISKASGTSSVSATTSWVTEAGDKQNTWTIKRPTYNSSYPVLFVAKQKKVVSGTVTCTTPVKDDTTTIIDGGHITTGTIDASKATITNISASMFTSSEQEKILNSKIEIGGRNLVWDTEWKHISTRWSDWGSPTTREIVTINGKRWLHIITTTANYQGYSQAQDKRNGYGEIKAGDKVIISYSAYAKTAGQTCTVGCHWRNSSGTIVAQNWFHSTLTTTEKRYTSAVFTIPNNAVGFNVMVGDGTATAQELWISQVKIEFGTNATDWSPAPEDIQSNAEDYADTAASTVKAELDLTKIDAVSESTSLLDNINAISDQITLLASRINFGNITVADHLTQLNTAVSIDTATSTVYVGDQSSFHVRINGTELGFYQGTQRVAYINNNQLYITQSVVLQQMDLGIPVIEGGLGQWSWKVHPNGQNPRRNNLNLKWIG